jgi:lysophospholipase L1-like esterase
MMQTLRNILLLTLPGLVVIFILLELTFSFIIPAAETPYYYFDTTDEILRFSTIKQRDGVYTIGSMAQHRARWHINNAGWNSPIEYEGERRRMRIALIGDSYVEALQVNLEDSVAGQLRRLISQDREVDVYAFGISGAPLSQYMQMARYVRAHFDPDILIINVVHNDFAESLCSTTSELSMLCLEDENGVLRERSIVPYEPSSLMRLKKSSLIRFMVINLQIRSQIQRLISSITTKPTYNANVDVSAIKSDGGKIAEATHYVLSTLKRENGKKPILIMMDAPRKDIYAGTMSESNVRWLNDLLKQKAQHFGFSFLDLTDEFKKSFERDHVRLDWPYDGHWNEKGHRVVAKALSNELRKIVLTEQY